MYLRILVCASLAVLGCEGDDASGGADAAAGGAPAGGDPSGSVIACDAGPASLEGLNIEFRRSELEAEVYRFGAGTFTRDLAPGELSENTGTFAWTGAPQCQLTLNHANRGVLSPDELNCVAIASNPRGVPPTVKQCIVALQAIVGARARGFQG